MSERRLAVVVGGASGSGLATARALAAAGDHVVIADLDEPAASNVVESLRAGGCSAEAWGVDIADEGSVGALADHLRRSERPVDVLYNSAAITDPVHQRADGPPADVSLPIWNRTLAVDLTGVMLTCRALLPLMRAPGGVIVNVTSNAGLGGNDTLAAYGVAKAGLHQLTRSIATAYGHLGIRCNALSPASIVSDSFLRNVVPAVADTMRSVCLLPDLGTVDDVAALARFLCSDDAAYITGEVVRVDGGALGHLAGAGLPPFVSPGSVGREPGPAAVIDDGGPVGDAVAHRLAADGWPVERWSLTGPLGSSSPSIGCVVVSAASAATDPWHTAAAADVALAALGARMAAAGGGSIVAALPLAGSSDASADAVGGATSALALRTAQDHGRSGVRANVVAFDAAIEHAVRAPGALLPHAGRGVDVAGAVSFLASPAARFITGVTLRVDGGRHARLPHTVLAAAPPRLAQEITT